MKYKILNTLGREFDIKAKDILNSLGEVDYEILSQENLLNKISKYDIVVCGLGLNFDSNILNSAKNLKIIVTATTGLDHIDLKTAEKNNIKVLSLKGEEEFLNTISGTAELALGLMLSIARNIPRAFVSVLECRWDRDRFKGHSLRGYTLGIVGLGRLGKMMAQYGISLGMKVIYTDPNVKSTNGNFKKVKFDELLKESDFISIHVHLTPETEYMFNNSTISKMKRTAYLINTSRGKIVKEDDIISLLEENKIAGYGTDVLDGEILFNDKSCNDHPLVYYAKKHGNVIILPHIGGMTYESRRDTDIFITNKLKTFVETL